MIRAVLKTLLLMIRPRASLLLTALNLWPYSWLGHSNARKPGSRPKGGESKSRRDADSSAFGLEQRPLSSRARTPRKRVPGRALRDIPFASRAPQRSSKVHSRDTLTRVGRKRNYENCSNHWSDRCWAVARILDGALRRV